MKNQFKCKVTEDRSVGDIPQRHEVGICLNGFQWTYFPDMTLEQLAALRDTIDNYLSIEKSKES